MSIKYSESDEWHNIECIPDNPRSILLYTKEGGVAEGSYNEVKDEWIQFRWNCKVNPIAWRELPQYGV